MTTAGGSSGGGSASSIGQQPGAVITSSGTGDALTGSDGGGGLSSSATVAIVVSSVVAALLCLGFFYVARLKAAYFSGPNGADEPKAAIVSTPVSQVSTFGRTPSASPAGFRTPKKHAIIDVDAAFEERKTPK